jgi:hypothetical protein
MNLLQHPRRLGFIIFNAAALVIFVSWIALTQDAGMLGLLGLPYYALGYLGMAILAITWVIAWIAWAWMVTARRLRHRA